MYESYGKYNVTIRVNKDSWEKITKILEETGITPNQYVSIVIDSLAMSEKKTFKDMIGIIIKDIINVSKKRLKEKKE